MGLSNLLSNENIHRLTELASVAGEARRTATYVGADRVNAATAVSTRTARTTVHIYTQSRTSRA